MGLSLEEYGDIEQFINAFTKKLIMNQKIPFSYMYNSKNLKITLNIEKKQK